MRCNRGQCEKPATRIVGLSSSVVQLVRTFCDDCAKVLCAEQPVAGATMGGVREPLRGTDLGPVATGTMQGRRIETPFADTGALVGAWPAAGDYYYQPNIGWCAVAPTGMMVGLSGHRVTEHEDGTITAEPSILVHGGGVAGVWHGHLERGVWRECLPGTTSSIRWPDGQVRPEEPYRCGAFLTATGEQCTLLSDHGGYHRVASDQAQSGASEVPL